MSHDCRWSERRSLTPIALVAKLFGLQLQECDTVLLADDFHFLDEVIQELRQEV